MYGKKRLSSMLGRKRGQIWVETVIYTLIAFVLIGLVLAFAKPKIEEIQDRSLIEQSIKVLEDMDVLIRNLGGPGNQRVLELGINKGTLNIDGVNNKLFFEIESRDPYTEPGEDVNIGNVVVRTEVVGDINDVTLTRDLSDAYDLTFGSKDEVGKVERASTPYRILITNEGDLSGKTIVDMEVIS